MKVIKVLHVCVEAVVLALIGASAFYLGTLDFKVLGGLQGRVMTLAQIIVCLTCIPGGLQVHRALGSLFQWAEEKVEEMMEE